MRGFKHGIPLHVVFIALARAILARDRRRGVGTSFRRVCAPIWHNSEGGPEDDREGCQQGTGDTPNTAAAYRSQPCDSDACGCDMYERVGLHK